MKNPNILEGKSIYIFMWVAFISIIILIAPFINSNIYARSQVILDGGSSYQSKEFDEIGAETDDDDPNIKSTGFKNQSKMGTAYRRLKEELKRTPGTTFKINVDENLVEKVKPETKDEKNKEVSMPKMKEIYKFHGDRAFSNEAAQEKVTNALLGRADFTWNVLHNEKLTGIYCSSRGVIMAISKKSRDNAYKGKIRQDKSNDVHEEFIKKIFNGELEVSRTKTDYKVVYSDIREARRPKASQMIFRGFKNNSKYMGDGSVEAVRNLAKKIGLKYTINKNGDMVVNQEEFKRLEDKYGKADRDMVGDFLVNTHWEFVDDKTIAERDYNESHGYIDMVEVENRYGDYFDLGDKGIGAFKIFTPISKVVIAGEVTGPETDIATLEETFVRSPKYVNSKQASPFSAYLIATEKVQDREADEEGKAPYKYSPGIMKEALRGIYRDGNKRRTNGVQAVWWQIAEGITGWNYVKRQYVEGKTPLLGGKDKAYFAPGRTRITAMLESDVQTWRKTWLAFMKYLKEKKDLKPVKAQKTHFIRYKNGKPLAWSKSAAPFQYEYKDYFNANKTHTFAYSARIPKYKPMFVAVGDKKPGDQKDVKFRREDNAWIVGPYKLDYFQYRMEEKLKSKHLQKHNMDGKPPLIANVINAELVGRYRTFPADGGDDKSEGLLDVDPAEDLRPTDKFDKKKTLEVVNALNKVTDSLDNAAPIIQKTNQIDSFNNVANIMNRIAEKLKNGKAPTGNQIDELGRAIEILKQQANKNLEGLTNDEKKILKEELNNLDKNYKELKDSLKGTKLDYNTNYINNLNKEISYLNISVQEALEFFEKMYMNKSGGSIKEKIFKEIYYLYENPKAKKELQEKNIPRFIEKFYDWENSFIVIFNAIQSGNKPSSEQIDTFMQNGNIIIKELNETLEPLFDKYGTGTFEERPFPIYTHYTFANQKASERRKKELGNSKRYFNIIRYDMPLITETFLAMDNEEKEKRIKEEKDPYVKEIWEELNKEREEGITGGVDYRDQEEYKTGQQVGPSGNYEKSTKEIAFDKRRDTSQKTDRQTEYGDQNKDFKWEDTIVEDNDSKHLSPKNTVNSLENLEGTYKGLVDKVRVRENSAEELFKYSAAQLSKDVKDKRGSKSNVNLYGGILADLGMIAADNEIMRAEGRDNLSDEELKSLSEYALSDQIMPMMPTYTKGAIDAANKTAEKANEFKKIIAEGSRLGIEGFDAATYLENTQNNSLAIKLLGSSKEYRNGTDVYNQRRRKAMEYASLQKESVEDCYRKTKAGINSAQATSDDADRNMREIDQNVKDLLEYPCEQAEDPDYCNRLKDYYYRQMQDAKNANQEAKNQAENRKRELQDFVNHMEEYRNKFNEAYPNMYNCEPKVNKIKYAKNIINKQIKENLNNNLAKIAKLQKIEKYKEEIKLSFERKKELEESFNKKQEDVKNEINKMEYLEFKGKIKEYTTQNQAENPEKKNNEENDSNKSEIKPIKNWKFLIEKPDNNKENDEPGQEKENRLPNPGEEFSYVIKHDPKLMEITSAIFDFGYMVTNSRFIYITSSYYSLSNLFANTQEAINDFTEQFENGLGLSDDAMLTPVLEGHIKELNNQVVSEVQSALWLNIIRIELKPNIGIPPKEEPKPGQNVKTGTKVVNIKKPGQLIREKKEIHKEPPEDDGPPNEKKVMARLYLPIAGQAWIDKLSGTKHLSYNHQLDGESEGEDLDGLVKVDVRRVAVKTKPSGDEVEIEKVLWKEQARLFEPETFKKIDAKNIYTDKEGKWGPYNIHDLSFSEKEFEKLKGLGYDKKDVAVVFEVVYSYDGLKYTEVLPLQNGGYNHQEDIGLENKIKEFRSSPNDFSKTSQAVENPHIRADFNRKFAEMEGQKPFDGPATKPAQVGENDTSGDHANSVKRGNGERLESIKLEYENKGPQDGSMYGTSELISYKAKEMFEKKNFKSKRIMYSSTLNLPLAFPIHKNINIPAESLEGNPDKVQKAKTSKGNYVEVPWYNGEKTKYYNAADYMKNINFGLKEREKLRLFASKDLLSASLFIKNKAITYFFNEGFDMNESAEIKDNNIAEGENNVYILDKNKLSQKTVEKNGSGKEYILDIYKVDYLYRTAMYSTPMEEPTDMGAMAKNKDLIKNSFGSYKEYAKAIYNQMQEDMQLEYKGETGNPASLEDTRQLDIFLTYKVSAGNMSDNDDVEITEIRDQYNSNFMQEVKKDMVKYTQENPNNLYQSYGKNSAKEVKISKTRAIKGSLFDDTLMENAKTTSDAGVSYNWGGEEGKGHAKKAFVSNQHEHGIRLAPLEKVDIYTVYRLMRDGTGVNGINIPNSINALDILSESGGIIGNIVEIGSFASYEPGTNVLSARVDEFSAPGNVPNNLDFDNRMRNIEEYMDYNTTRLEADTAFAPGLKLSLNNENDSRKMSGVVWEDSRNDKIDVALSGSNENANIYVGNGKKEEEEKPIKNQKIILEERIPVEVGKGIGQTINSHMNTTINPGEYLDVPFIWPSKVNVGDGKQINLNEQLGLDSVQITDESGAYDFKGIPAGNFVIKVPYTSQGKGNDADNPPEVKPENLAPTADQSNRTIKWINGVDFKSTFYRNNDDNNLNETWISKMAPSKEKNLSYIRDDEFRRAEVMRNVSNINHDIHKALESMDIMNPEEKDINIVHDGGRMVATTPKMLYSIENLEALEDQILKNAELKNLTGMYEGTRFLKGANGVNNDLKYPSYYKVDNVNAGLVQRPISKMELRKDITNVSLETNNGKKIVDLKFDLVLGEPENGEDVNIYEPYLGAVDMRTKFNANESTGKENVMILNTLYGNRFSLNSDDKNIDEIKQGFIYINMDEQLMQGSTIKAEYAIRAVNLSEPDIFEKETREKLEKLQPGDFEFNKKVKAYYAGVKEPIEESVYLNHEKIDEFKYGHILAKNYYKPMNAKELTLEQLDTLEIQEVMDVINNNCEYNENAFKGRDEEKYALWKKASKQDLVNKIVNYRGVRAEKNEDLAKKADEIELKDENGVPYIDNKRSNIYISTNEPKRIKIPGKDVSLKGILPIALFVNSEKAKENIEEYSMEKWYIGTQKYIASLALEKDLSFDNTAELLKYNIEGGKRLRGIRPGDVFSNEENKESVEKLKANKGNSEMFAKSILQKDAFTTELITLTPPTGIKLENKKQMIKIILASSILAIFTGTMLYARKSYLKKITKDSKK